jgi:hypothetical protein
LPAAPVAAALAPIVLWADRYAKMVEYQKGHGNCCAPLRTPLGNRTGKLQTFKREIDKYKKLNNGVRVKTTGSQLTEKRIELLDKIGFEWSLRNPAVRWAVRFEELKAFQKGTGHCHVSRYSKTIRGLGEWVHNQRGQYKRKEAPILGGRTRLLNEIGFDWNPG